MKTENKSRLRILAHVTVSLNANCFIFTSGCLLLFTFNYTFMAQKFYFTIYIEFKRHCLCTVPTCHICITAEAYHPDLGDMLLLPVIIN